MNGNYRCEWHIASNTAHVPPLVREVLETLHDELEELTQEEHGDIKLILNELMFNAVLHGNHGNEKKRVHVSLSISKRIVCVSITDEGTGFDADETMISLMRDEGLRRESGRGMALVTALADEVVYSCDGRQVTFVKRVGVRQPAFQGV